MVSRSRRSVLLVLAPVLAGAALTGCGGGGARPSGSTQTFDATSPTAGTGLPSTARRHLRARPKAHPIAPRRASSAAIAHVDATSDATLVAVQAKAQGNAIVSAGAPSDAEIRSEIAQAAKAGIALPSGNTAQAFIQSEANVSISYEQALAVGASIPLASWNPGRKPIADWIVPVLKWAAAHGWTGTVTSGFRTYLEQAALNAAGNFSAPAGLSNHESTQYPGGAVDVTNSAQLIQVLAGYPGPEKLHGGVLGPIDPEHFSATGL